MPSSRRPPTYVDLTKLVFVKEMAYEALPRRFLRSPLIHHHILPTEDFSLHLAKSVSAKRFRVRPDKSAHTVMPQPQTMLLYKHKKSGQLFLKCTFPRFRVYTFFKGKASTAITTKIELDVSIYFTASGHLSYVQRLGEKRYRPPAVLAAPHSEIRTSHKARPPPVKLALSSCQSSVSRERISKKNASP